jgi:hypothetical protein
MRTFGCLIGTLGIAVGAYLVFHRFESNWWLNWVAPLSLIGTGIYFINYGLTGRGTLIRRSESLLP